ncbi:MAG: two-component regulator propeller domain-containing protein [Chitinophagales bacterium]
MKSPVLFFLLHFSLLSLSAQNVGIGEWKTHLPYFGVIAAVDAGDKVYCANTSSVFAYVKSDNSYERLSTAAGFSDIGIKGINYDYENQTLVIAYTNSNIDFLFGSEIYNYPFILSSNINGDKNIYDAYFFGDTVILSCGFGLVLFDIEKRESPATFFFTDTTGSNTKVNGSTVFNNSIYAATVSGIFKGDLSETNLQDFSKWDSVSGFNGLPAGDAKFIAAFDNELYTLVGDTIYKLSGSEWEAYFFEDNWTTTHIRSNNGFLLISQVHGDAAPADTSRVLIIDSEGTVNEVSSPTNLSYVNQADVDAGGILWIADSFRQLVRVEGNNYSYYVPNGPGSSRVFDMESFNGVLYVAPGEINPSWIYEYNRDGFFYYDFGWWATLDKYNVAALDTTLDFISVAVDPVTGIAYFGSYGGGLLEFNKLTGEIKIYEDGFIEETPGDITNYRVSGLAFDLGGNLWITNYAAVDPIAVKKADGTWKNINPNMPLDIGNQVGQVVVDEFSTKWIQLAKGNGILAYNENGTIDDESDDLVKVLSAGSGNGNLHTNYINCLAVDKQGEIWVGTDEGVTIFYNPSEVYSNTTAGDATQPLVNLGGYYEALLRNDIVNAIEVDGANRKWVGTNSGVFLISADGTEQLLYFNKDNSPLISNAILEIEVDGITGDVYFGTANGIISYRYTATDGVQEISEVTVFPNPVREDYTGPIAISGLTENAEVSITDSGGRMVYETTALGGQAIWDGNGYNGNRAKTGVYLVYSSNEDGSQTYVAKILLVNGDH